MSTAEYIVGKGSLKQQASYTNCREAFEHFLQLEKIEEELLDQRYDCFYPDVQPDNVIYNDHIYSVPKGFSKFGIKVPDFSPYERWSIGYHVSPVYNIKSILNHGLVKSGDFAGKVKVKGLHGDQKANKGKIFLSNTFKVSKKYGERFQSSFEYQGSKFMTIFMCRTSSQHCEKDTRPEIGETYENFTLTQSEYIVPYAILIKELK